MHPIEQIWRRDVFSFAVLVLSRASVEEDQLLPRCKKRLERLSNVHTKRSSSDYIWQSVDDMITLRRLLSNLSRVREKPLGINAVPDPS